MEPIDYLTIVVFSLLLAVIIASTVYDKFTRSKPYEPKKVFIAFSLLTNAPELLKLEPKSSKFIHFFNGLRAVSALWVIAGHRTTINNNHMMSMKLNNWFAEMIIAIVTSNDYAVDTFFLISGVLITQSCLKALDTNRLNLAKVYVTRYMRYVPTVAVLLLFYVSSLQFFLVDGPFIGHLEGEVKHCRDYWWSSLLLIQNYVNVYEICLAPTWYLSVDFQLFLLSPFFIYLLWKFKQKALWLFAAIIVLTQTSVFYLRYNDIVSIHIIYRQTHYRLGQFLIGIALGYIMKVREGKTFMRKRSKIIGWIVSLGLVVAVEVFHETHKHQRFAEAFHASIHRITWSIFVAWTVFVCHHLKSGGIINWFFSHQLWQPIARISLSIYLVHQIYIVMTLVNNKEKWNLELMWLVHIMIADMTVSTMLGAALYLVIEAPSGVILKYFMK